MSKIMSKIGGADLNFRLALTPPHPRRHTHLASMRKLGFATCALAIGVAFAPMASALGLEDLETFEQLESMDLFAAAISAAEADDIPRARALLEQALGTSGATQGRAEAERAIAAAESRERERIRAEEEARRLAAEEEERRRVEEAAAAARAAAASRPRGYSNDDFRNLCLGATDYSSFCYSIDNPDLQNLCLGRSQRSDTWCYSINNPDLKNLCLGISRSDYATFCYSIDDPDIENTCLAASSYGYRDFCYSIPNNPWRSLCGGLALSSNNCYNFR